MTTDKCQPWALDSSYPPTMAQIDPITGYISNINEIRRAEYPILHDTTYLDHAGTTLYAKSLVEAFSKAMTSNLLGNPHSASLSSQLSSRLIDDTRLQVLRFFNANPDEFDVVFVANATAAIKLVADAFRDNHGGFWYGYHADAHTSLVGVRELAEGGSRCFQDDVEVSEWISSIHDNGHGAMLRLFAYPGQSNMTGHKRPLEWCRQIRSATISSSSRMYTLYDAAGLVSTSPLDLSNCADAPDFTTLSFYKMFGFPDLGALIIRKASGPVLHRRRYFGGGTVDMVITTGEPWHSKRSASLHSGLEDGTAPFHSILALTSALSVHTQLYGCMGNISAHTAFLAGKAFADLSGLRHANGAPVCKFYGVDLPEGGAWVNRGPVIAFNLLDSKGRWVGTSEVETLAVVKNIQLRTGGLCNPGGIARHLDLSSDEMRKNFASGQRCGDEHGVIHGKPVGTLRVSFGAMSSLGDVAKLISFVEEFYVLKSLPQLAPRPCHMPVSDSGFFIESLSIYPIKSCAAYPIPPAVKWEVKDSGLAYDREWCLVHQGTGSALSQKRYPQMALLRPSIDLAGGILRIVFLKDNGSTAALQLSLAGEERWQTQINVCDVVVTSRVSSVCGDDVVVQVYDSPDVAAFFTEALGVPCTLARCPPSPGNRIGRLRRPPGHDVRGSLSLSLTSGVNTEPGKSILLSNESPILLISRSSVNRLNEDIKAANAAGRAVSADSFRGNIVIAEEAGQGAPESPYMEETWRSLQIGEGNVFEVMGPCQRCQMVCVDQKSAQKRQEPFSTLAKTRRRDGKVWFGVHLCLGDKVRAQERAQERADATSSESSGRRTPERSWWIRVGDRVLPSL